MKKSLKIILTLVLVLASVFGLSKFGRPMLMAQQERSKLQVKRSHLLSHPWTSTRTLRLI